MNSVTLFREKNRGVDWTLGINTNSNAAKDVHDELDLKLRPNQNAFTISYGVCTGEL